MPGRLQITYVLPEGVKENGKIMLSQANAETILKDAFETAKQCGFRGTLTELVTKIRRGGAELSLTQGSTQTEIDFLEFFSYLGTHDEYAPRGCVSCKNERGAQVGNRMDDIFRYCNEYEISGVDDKWCYDRETSVRTKTHSRDNSPRVRAHDHSACQEYNPRNDLRETIEQMTQRLEASFQKGAAIAAQTHRE